MDMNADCASETLHQWTMCECTCGDYSQPMLVARIIRFAFNVGGTFIILFMLTTIGLLLMLLAAATKVR